MILYKKGYLIRVTSWENDGDNYSTDEVHEVDEQRAKQIVEFVKLFSKGTDEGGIGNIYNEGYPMDGEVSYVRNKFIEFGKKYPDFFEEIPEDESYISDWSIDYAHDLGLSGGDYYTRMCEKVEVFYFEEDVECEKIKW